MSRVRPASPAGAFAAVEDQVESRVEAARKQMQVWYRAG